jgi:integrase
MTDIHALIRRLEAGGKPLVARGVEVRRLGSGDLVYKTDFRAAGRRDHTVLGRESDGMTWRRALDLVARRRAELRQTAGLAAPPESKGPRLPFSAAVAVWLEHEAAIGGRNLKRKRAHVRLHLLPHFGSLPIGAFSAERLKAYRQHRREQEASDPTCNGELATLSSFLTFCARAKKWLPARPCLIPRTPESGKARQVLGDAERAALLESAIADMNPLVWLFTLFVISCPMRHAEILNSRYEDLDAGNSLLAIRRAKDGPRSQPLPPQLCEVLAERRERVPGKSGWIFPSKVSKTGHIPRMTEHFARVVTRAGLDPHVVTPHLGRHTAASRLAAAGVDLATLKQVTGHKSTAVAERYIHLYGERIRGAAALLGMEVPRNSPETPPTAPAGEVESAPQTAKIVAFSRR